MAGETETTRDVVFTFKVSDGDGGFKTFTRTKTLTIKNPCVLADYVTITKDVELPDKTYYVYKAEEEYAQVTVFTLTAPNICGPLAFKPYLETTLIDGDDMPLSYSDAGETFALFIDNISPTDYRNTTKNYSLKAFLQNYETGISTTATG